MCVDMRLECSAVRRARGHDMAMQEWWKLPWNERFAAAALLMGVVTTVFGLGMMTMGGTAPAVTGGVIALVGFILLGASYAVYRL